MLHFVKLNSRQIQIIKQTPNILFAKISAYAVEHTKLLLVVNEVCLCGLVSTYCERCEFVQRHVAGELVVAARTILGLFPMMCVIRSYLPCVPGRTIYQFVCSSGHSSYWFHIPFPQHNTVPTRSHYLTLIPPSSTIDTLLCTCLFCLEQSTNQCIGT